MCAWKEEKGSQPIGKKEGSVRHGMAADELKKPIDAVKEALKNDSKVATTYATRKKKVAS